MAKVSFTGGPLDQQMREMDVYVSVIPVSHYNGEFYGDDERGHPRACYINVNTVIVNEQLRNSGFSHYVFHIDGRRVPSAGQAGPLRHRPDRHQTLRPTPRMDAERTD